MQRYPFIEIDENQDIMHQMTPFIKKNSLHLPWDNFYLLDMDLPHIIVPEIAWDAVIITCYLDQKSSNTEISAAGHIIPRQLTPGIIGVWKPHFPVGFTLYEPIKLHKCILSVKYLERIALETTNQVAIELNNSWWDQEDPLIAQIIKTLISEMSQGCPHGKFYGDSLIMALSAHLLCNYTNKNKTIAEYKGGLSRSKLKLALEYIHGQININISLAEISAELDISQYHFCRLFKQSMGISPYQYIIKKRVEYAQNLLKRTDHKIIDIAMDVGFANQGHFSHHFRKIVGITPKQYRDSIRE
jgi:AraC family transcriptional regulator